MTDRNDSFDLDARYVAEKAKQAVHDLVRPLGDALRYAERTTRPRPQPEANRGKR